MDPSGIFLRGGPLPGEKADAASSSTTDMESTSEYTVSDEPVVLEKKKQPTTSKSSKTATKSRKTVREPSVPGRVKSPVNNGNSSSAPRKGALKKSPSSSPKVVIVGGGPVALAAGHLLLEYGRRTGIRFDIHMYDRRWTRKDNTVEWKSWMDNNNRREQTVTLQSNVYSLLPKHVKEALFPKDDPNAFAEMWAKGPDSQIGFPRNIKIKRVENVLLDLMQQEATIAPRFQQETAQIPPTLHPIENTNTLPKEAFQDAQFCILADGGSMSTERHLFPGVFGQRQPFPDDPNLELAETVLGIYVEKPKGAAIGLSEAETVVMTSAQNRFLLNPLGRKSGFLNMWLTREEAKVAVGINTNGFVQISCSQRTPCSFSRCADGKFRCSTHSNVLFWPCLASNAPERDESPGATLWNRILDGLKLYDIQLQDVMSFTTFKLGPYMQRMSFTRNLSTALAPGGGLDLPFHMSHTHPPFCAVIGDAAFPVSFRAGRGLNTGIKAAVSLCRSITFAALNHRGWRMSDFVQHEGFMAALQMREVTCRSLQMMQVEVSEESSDENDSGFERVIDKLQRGIAQPSKDPRQARKILLKSMEKMSRRLANRLPVDPPNVERIKERLCAVSDETACVLYEGGPWNTVPVGGKELGHHDMMQEPLWVDSYLIELYGDEHLNERLQASGHDSKFLSV